MRPCIAGSDQCLPVFRRPARLRQASSGAEHEACNAGNSAKWPITRGFTLIEQRMSLNLLLDFPKPVFRDGNVVNARYVEQRIALVDDGQVRATDHQAGVGDSHLHIRLAEGVGQVAGHFALAHHIANGLVGPQDAAKGSLVRARKGAMRSRRSGKWREWLIKP